MAENDALGVIGGSGLYEIEELTDVAEQRVETPFGEPSDAFVTGRLGEQRLVFLPRHGRGHRIAPHEINYRANLYGMKKLGVTRLLAISAVGSMKEGIAPGDFVIVDQFIDRTTGRKSTFFEDGIVGHVGFADPVCQALAQVAVGAARAAGVTVHEGGTYVCINGPQFSTRAESHLYRSWGVDVIGMTNVTEAKVAREAEICFATVALATDFDCWHEGEGDVDVKSVLAILSQNVENARKVVVEVARSLPAVDPGCPCQQALRHAILAAPTGVTEGARTRLALLLGKYR
ncbi:MAG: S-methyl-5'-thioadenosine phosphorylase [bacterium]